MSPPAVMNIVNMLRKEEIFMSKNSAAEYGNTHSVLCFH